MFKIGLQGRLFIVVLMSIFACVTALEASAADQPLESLHGLMRTAYNVDPNSDPATRPAIVNEFWAKGNYIRYESFDADGNKSIGIQHGDTMYSYAEGGQFGVKVMLQGGLGAMGLVRALNVVLAQENHVGAKTIDGIIYDQYAYDDQSTGERVSVAVSRKTSTPLVWMGFLPNQNITMIKFKDIQVNIEIPDDKFTIPDDIDF